ncbi:MarR family protein [Stackebrandtia albiflava]|uniref:MarR family protein n=1 Tax=Stackebrandtia albiflava TaxID=406432 RepID=A0A562V2L6_9ACTN|nr:MarR family transcriptional regulator [Stackebrandtia albiflava]TWJ12072.1 MarR family protein [Stackebrandtia albiflava]
MSATAPATRDETAVRGFIETYSAMMADYGLPRMAARVMAAELAAEEDALTAADLAERLGASPAAISNALKYLTHIGFLIRESVPNSRRDLYRVAEQDWYTLSLLKSGRFKELADAAGNGVEAVGGPDTVAGKRLGDVHDFYRFIHDQMPILMERWTESRQDPPVSSPHVDDVTAH